jgi:hypothetical protein
MKAGIFHLAQFFVIVPEQKIITAKNRKVQS